MLWPIIIHPTTVPRIAVGIAMITAMGEVQLSYWAASTRSVIMTAKSNTAEIVVPACVS